MVNCEFLLQDTKSSCAGCRGWFCTASGKKKLGDIRECQSQWDECPRYLAVHPKPVEERESVSTADYVKPVAKAKPKKKTKPKKKIAAPVAYTIITPPPPSDCPYMGPVPAGEYGCCGYWCLAKDEPLRSVKRCRDRPSWLECRRRYDAEREGVKYALGRD